MTPPTTEPDPAADPAAFAVRVDGDSLEWLPAGGIYGTVVVTLGERHFPDADWGDFAVVVLAWWIDAFVRLAAGGRTAEWRFMDGPYRIDVAAAGGGTVTVSLVRREAAFASAAVPLSHVADQLDAAADAVLRACADQRWRAPEIERLKQSHDRLRALLAVLPR